LQKKTGAATVSSQQDNQQEFPFAGAFTNPASAPGAEKPGKNLREALRDRRFWLISFIFFSNITVGIGLLALASPIAQHEFQFSASDAALLVSVLSLVNAAGRLSWASLSDWIGRTRTYRWLFVVEALAFLTLLLSDNQLLFTVALLFIVSCYGGGFSSLPALIATKFGEKHIAEIHGATLLNWSLAGFAGPLIVASLPYKTSITIFLAQMLASLLATYYLILLKRRKF
jgi:OFA family oxalate/formate antiporter-like MFS transporter